MRTNILLLALICLFTLNLSVSAQAGLVVGTQITMGDDTRKNVADVSVGDVVLSYDYTRKVYEKKKITGTDKIMYSRMVRFVLENKLQILATSDYPFWGERGWVSVDTEATATNPKYKDAKELNIGDYLHYYEVLSTSSDCIAFVEGIMEPLMAYSLHIEGGGTIIANGFIVGTK
jgi:intein/homing endonuclease